MHKTGMKVYLSAPYTSKRTMIRWRVILEAHGHRIVSTWDCRLAARPVDDALQDLQEIRNADIFLLSSFGTSPGGRYVELGYAYAHGKSIILVGPEGKNIFHMLPGICHATTLQQAIRWMTE